jgi:xylan 1,4-beta-xylosidase
MNTSLASIFRRVLPVAALFAASTGQAAADSNPAPMTAPATSWTPDNGNGSYTNPLFYDEFSDPDMIRVGEDYYLAGTTMHAVPGVVVLHSKDLVNWEFLSYAMPRFDIGEEFDLVNGKEAYGQGIWAPCIRYHDGTFYIFSNVNGRGMQVFTAKNPAGPWKHRNMGGTIYDLSVIFENGRIYAVHGYDEVHVTEIKSDFSGYVEGSDRVIIPHGNAMGEGHHFYKIGGKYYIISANFAPTGRMQCARADKIDGPYETVTISMRETMGWKRASTVANVGGGSPVPEQGAKFDVNANDDNFFAAVPLHQGGIVQLPNGDWWGFSMADFMSVGRTTCLSPVTWKDGWPYFGLPKNLGRTPRTWVKPDTGANVAPMATYRRCDDFSGSKLIPVWQWNHNPVDSMWSLSEKPGVLRLHTLPAKDFLWARNSLTQRSIGPESIATVELDAAGLAEGDIAGLGLLNMPCAWIGVVKTGTGLTLRWYKQDGNLTIEKPLGVTRVWLRASGDFDHGIASLSYSTDGKTFAKIGGAIDLPYQLKTFQGTRYALFAYNAAGKDGGYADFDNFSVKEPLADRSADIPLGKIVTLTNLANGKRVYGHKLGMLYSADEGSEDASGPAARFRVLDRGKGRVALESTDGRGFVCVVGEGLSADVRILKEESEGCLFQWQDLLRGECMLLSIKTQRYVGANPDTGEPYGADWAGTRPDRKDGTVFVWSEAVPEKESPHTANP